MKKLCIATYVFGDKYQGFVPIYIYSILKIYPDYDIRIYLDKTLNSSIKKQLDIIKFMGKFDIIERFNNNFDLSDKAKTIFGISKAIRWLIYDECFAQYDSVYIGDIDIFICKETIGLYEQHIKHCDFLGLPYSNIVRSGKFDKSLNIKNLIKLPLKFGFIETFKYYRNTMTEFNRLSGLHFVRTKSYYSKIRSVIPEFLHKLNDIAIGKASEWNTPMITSDEMILYEIVKKSGIGLPAKMLIDVNTYSSDNYNQLSFRPHHGLHLGIFRPVAIGDPTVQSLVSSDTYTNYYKHFCYLRENDPVFRQIQAHFDPYIINIINRMDNYFNSFKN